MLLDTDEDVGNHGKLLVMAESGPPLVENVGLLEDGHLRDPDRRPKLQQDPDDPGP